MELYKEYKQNNYKFNERIIVKLSFMNLNYGRLNSARIELEKERKGIKEFYEILFPKGTKIQLIRFNPEEPRYPSGTIGIVEYVDDAGQIHVSWSNGGSLAISPEYDDEFKLI